MDATSPVNHQNHARESFIEAVHAEKQLWTLIHSMGPLNTDVQELYHKTRSSYESAILHDQELAELRDVEHALWRLHYKHIDEFRNRIETDSAGGCCIDLKVPQDDAVVQNDCDIFREGFRSFLSEANEFYQGLIIKIQGSYGLAKEVFKEYSFSNNCNGSIKVQKGQFLCHRCLVCLGDLARYNELYANCDIHKHNWSVVAAHYLNASVLWPDSGNPQNQLFVLAIYIGDELLALYHCIRSLAVKEPFFNARDNLILLFEKNRSSHFQSLSNEVTFNFCKPSERSVAPATSSGNNSNSNILEATEEPLWSDESCLWRLIVRMISFCYIKSSVDDFTCSFASTMRELEALVSLDDAKLKAVLESYQHMRVDTAIAGPFRLVQVVCILIFSIHFLGENQHLHRAEQLQPVSIELALVATFICVGRLVHRCAVANPTGCSVLLPGILVFVEWLAVRSDIAILNVADERYGHALNYFGSVFVDLLNKFTGMEEICTVFLGGDECADHIALWEDHELQGFAPLAPVHEQSHFMYGGNRSNSFEEGHENHIRIHRILVAAIKLASMSNGSRKWIFYDETEKMFHTSESNLPERVRSEMNECKDNICRAVEENEMHGVENSLVSGMLNGCGKPIHEEEDEVIVFKPIIRNNSAPLCAPIVANHGDLLDRLHDQLVASSDSTPRGSSLLIEQTHMFNDNPSSFHSDSRCIKVPLAEDSAKTPTSDSGIPFYFSGQNTQRSRLGISDNRGGSLAGAPSLSPWGFKREFLDVAENQEIKDSRTHSGFGIEDLSSAYMRSLSINGVTERQQDTEVPHSSRYEYGPILKGDHTSTGLGYTSAATYYFEPPYHVGPLPSAPLLPEVDDVFCSGNSLLPFIRHDTSDSLQHNATMLGQRCLEDQKGVPNFVTASSRADDYLKWIKMQGPPAYNPGFPGYNRCNALSPAGVETGTWPNRYWDNLHQGRGHDLGGIDRFHAPTSYGRFQDFDVPRLATYDRWGQPMNLVYGADEERRERFFHGNYQSTIPHFGYGGVIDERSERQILLQYLKDQEWRLQQLQQQKGSAQQ